MSPRTRPFLLSRLAFLASLGALLLLVLQAAATYAVLRQGRTAALAYGQDRVSAAAEAALASVNRGFLAVDAALAGLPNLLATAVPPEVAADPAARGAALSRVLGSLNDGSLYFRDVILLPMAGGAPVAAALSGSRRRPPPVPHDQLLARPEVAAGRGGGMTIAGPVPNPATGEWSLFFARPVELRGLPPLLAVAEVPVPLVASGMLGVATEAEGQRLRVRLVRSEDRTLLASAPHDEGRIGRPLPREAAEGEEPDRLSALRQTLYPSLALVVGQDRDSVLAAWRGNERTVLAAFAGFALFTLVLAGLLLVMLRQRDRTERERARGRRLLEAAIEAMSDGFVMWDEADRLLVCNERYRDFYRVSLPFIRPGVTLEELIREGARRGQYPDAGEDPEGFVAETMAKLRQPWNTAPVERLLPDGRWVLVTERRVPGGGAVGIRTDITQQKRAAAELAAARDAAAAAAAAKSRFLARMSHELRTPLNGVLGMAQALARDPGLDEAQRAQARVLEQAGQHLLSVANDVLDLAHVEAGRVRLAEAPTDLPALLEAVVQIARPAAEAKGLRLSLRRDPGLPRWVRLDPLRVRQLALNLLSNATKFTPAGGTVSLRALAGEEGGMLRIEVLDSGPGIPEAQRRAVFRDFVRLGQGVSPEYGGGAGLGLAISAGIVEAMGGRLGVDDNPEETGARFWAEMPLRACEAAEPAAPAETEPEGGPLRLLVADDVATNRLVARALLGRLGHEVAEAPGGAEAVEAVRRAARAGRPFDLVLMDLSMPVVDGLEATRRLRALPPGEGSEVAVVALTAGVFESDSAACREAGMDGYVSKPVTVESLRAALAAALPRRAPAEAA